MEEMKDSSSKKRNKTQQEKEQDLFQVAEEELQVGGGDQGRRTTKCKINRTEEGIIKIRVIKKATKQYTFTRNKSVICAK